MKYTNKWGIQFLIIACLLLPAVSNGQKIKVTKADKQAITNLKTVITYLASDQLEGRRTGSRGEKLAYEFIIPQFEKAGLQPKGTGNSYLQPFEVNEGKEITSDSWFIINSDTLTANTDYFPLPFSNNAILNTSASPDIRENEAPWFLDIADLMEKNMSNPHFDLLQAIKDKSLDFQNKGASAVIVYNDGSHDDELQFQPRSHDTLVRIPVIFVKDKKAKKIFTSHTTDVDLKGIINIGDKKRTGYNVVGFLDNGAKSTIAIGGHYDHLGYGEDHNSLWTGPREIHNGADDNASGTAAVIELANMLKKSKLKSYNYLFICFSGEELGLFGSKYFADNSTIPLESFNYMINCDMVGRLNDSTHGMSVGGYGTSPEWGKIVPQKSMGIVVKFDSSGLGPSDHTSFYLKNIPVLFFFTGTHPDYHKPTDDVEKINFPGELQVIKYIFNILKETNKMGKLTFSKTREPQIESVRFTVSLGIMPDYTYTGEGLRADGIIGGKVAEKAGLHAGDIIMELGNYKITDINNYMKALSKFKKGDSTSVKVKRGNDLLEFKIVF